MKYQEVLSKLDQIISRIHINPEYSSCFARKEYQNIRNEAEKHSLEMELQGDLEINISKAGDLVKARDKHKSNAAKRLKVTQSYLAENGIDLTSLYTLGYKISPLVNKVEGFRQLVVQYGPFFGENPEKIPFKLDDLLYFLKDTSTHPVFRASNTHLELVKIHPYLDGNGRAARLIQNQLLQERGYPPAIIHSDEKKDYLAVLKGAIKGSENGLGLISELSSGEKIFHEFIALKVLDSAIHVESELKSRRMYEVNLTGVSNFGMVMALKDKLISFRKRLDSKGISVSIDKKHSGKKRSTLKVIGDITQSELRNDLDRFTGKYGIKFEINVNPNKLC